MDKERFNQPGKRYICYWMDGLGVYMNCASFFGLRLERIVKSREGLRRAGSPPRWAELNY